MTKSEVGRDSRATGGGRACANCGYAPMESFCPQCGQSDRHYARSLGSVVLEFLREMFELDSRLFRTLRLLFFKPGSLTREFSRNRRVSFVSPVRLYIFASFLFFLLLSLVGDFGNVVEGGMTEEDAEDAVAQPSDAETQPPTEERLAAFMAALPPEQQRKADDILRRPEGDVGRRIILSGAAEEFEEWNWIGQLFALGVIDILHDPSVVRQRLLANMPIAMFFVLPVLGVVLAIFHLRKKRFYVEHLVFAIHIQTFTFLVYAIVLLLPDEGLGGLIRAGCLLIPYPYFVIALRRYYENGWVLSVAKSVGVYMLYSLVLLPAFVISVFVTG